MRNHVARLEASQRRSPQDAEVTEAMTLGRLLLSVLKGDVVAAGRLADEYLALSCLRACDGPQLIVGRFFLRHADQDRAGRWLSPTHQTVVPPLTTLFALERARIAEQRGLSEAARREFTYVVDMWRNADSSLDSTVSAARAALARLSPR